MGKLTDVPLQQQRELETQRDRLSKMQALTGDVRQITALVGAIAAARKRAAAWKGSQEERSLVEIEREMEEIDGQR